MLQEDENGWAVIARPDGTLTGPDGRSCCCLSWEGKPCNLISFQGATYTDHARLAVLPQPDTVLRVFMARKPRAESADVPVQTLMPLPGRVLPWWSGAAVRYNTKTQRSDPVCPVNLFLCWISAASITS